MIVENLALVVVPSLAELFGEDEPPEEPDLILALSLSSSLLGSLPEVCNLDVLAV